MGGGRRRTSLSLIERDQRVEGDQPLERVDDEGLWVIENVFLCDDQHDRV
jgi:hypothetical protein